MQIGSVPVEIDQLERRATNLEIERQALRKENDPSSRERLGVVEKELAGIREKANALKAAWKQEREGIQRISDIKEAQKIIYREIPAWYYELRTNWVFSNGNVQDFTFANDGLELFDRMWIKTR